jgi:hypothetical protein
MALPMLSLHHNHETDNLEANGGTQIRKNGGQTLKWYVWEILQGSFRQERD